MYREMNRGEQITEWCSDERYLQTMYSSCRCAGCWPLPRRLQPLRNKERAAAIEEQGEGIRR
jgi:hypothetical protein